MLLQFEACNDRVETSVTSDRARVSTVLLSLLAMVFI